MGIGGSKQKKQLELYTGHPESTDPYPIPGAKLNDMMGNRDFAIFNELDGINGLCKALNTDVKTGITDDTIAQRQVQYGHNKEPDPVIVPFIKIWFDALKDKTLIILMIAAVVSLVLGIFVPSSTSTDECANLGVSSSDIVEADKEFNTDWIEGAAILVAVFLVSFCGSISDYSKQKKFLALETKEKDIPIQVQRNGTNTTVSILDLVVGDIVYLHVGDILPADGVVIDPRDLRVDESDMTGESDAVKKEEGNEKGFYLMSGCKITDGSGMMLVTNVGPNSMWGKTKRSLSDNKSRPTPLQENLDSLAVKIGYFGMGAGILVFIVLSIYYAVSEITHKDVIKGTNGCELCPEGHEVGQSYSDGIECEEYVFEWSSLTALVDYFILGVTIVVAAVPEGLPLAVTISLAYSMKQMFRDNNLVRHLKACETMSNCTNICSDKTGTLTENRMRVVYGWFGGYKMEHKKYEFEMDAKYEELIHADICTNSSPSTAVEEVQTEVNGEVKVQDKVIGNKTEGALLLFSKSRGVNYLDIREKYKDSVYQQFPFSSLKKRMNTLVWSEDKSKIYMFTKGAPEMILSQCTTYYDQSGEIKEITP